MITDEEKAAEAYRAEIQRRVQKIRSGTAIGIPVENVLAELRSRIQT